MTDVKEDYICDYPSYFNKRNPMNMAMLRNHESVKSSKAFINNVQS